MVIYLLVVLLFYNYLVIGIMNSCKKSRKIKVNDEILIIWLYNVKCMVLDEKEKNLSAIIKK